MAPIASVADEDPARCLTACLTANIPRGDTLVVTVTSDYTIYPPDALDSWGSTYTLHDSTVDDTYTTRTTIFHTEPESELDAGTRVKVVWRDPVANRTLTLDHEPRRRRRTKAAPAGS